MPTTFVLPQEYLMFVEEFKRCAKQVGGGKHWIMKPIGKAQGKGIFLFDNLKTIAEWRPSEHRWKTNGKNQVAVSQRGAGAERENSAGAANTGPAKSREHESKRVVGAREGEHENKGEPKSRERSPVRHSYWNP